MRTPALLAPALLIPLLAACGSGDAANNAAAAPASASEREADEDVIAAESDAANVAATDAELDRLANEVGAPAANTTNAR